MSILLPLALGVLVLTGSAPALACSREPTSWVELASEVPADGVVGFATCTDATECMYFVGVTVMNASGGTVAGEVKTGFAGSYVRAYWVPTAPLTVGERYTLSWTSAPPYALGKLAGGSFTAVASVSPFVEGEQAVFAGFQSQVTEGGESHCCAPSPGQCAASCIHAVSHSAAALQVSLTGVEKKSAQWTYAVRFGTGSNVVALTAFNGFRTSYAPEEKRYCYSVTATPVEGGAELELAAACLDNTLTLPEDRIKPQSALDSFAASCPGVRDAAVRGAGEDASVRDAGEHASEHDAGGEVSERDAGDHAPAAEVSTEGCQLALKDRSGTLTTALILLAIAASGARRRRR